MRTLDLRTKITVIGACQSTATSEIVKRAGPVFA